MEYRWRKELRVAKLFFKAILARDMLAAEDLDEQDVQSIEWEICCMTDYKNTDFRIMLENKIMEWCGLNEPESDK